MDLSTPPAPKADVVELKHGGKSEMKPIGGSDNTTFNSYLLARVLDARRGIGTTPEEKHTELEATVHAMLGFKPQDEIEGMMAAQAVAMHHSAMECSRRAMLREQPFEIAQGLRKAAATATRTFIEIVGALDRKRGKGGQQKVVVEHVHVHAGGQAVVGNVELSGRTGGGGGADGKTEGQPCAPPAQLAEDSAARSVVPPLRGPHQKRKTMPVAGDAKRPMPHARRQIDGATDG